MTGNNETGGGGYRLPDDIGKNFLLYTQRRLFGLLPPKKSKLRYGAISLMEVELPSWGYDEMSEDEPHELDSMQDVFERVIENMITELKSAERINYDTWIIKTSPNSTAVDKNTYQVITDGCGSESLRRKTHDWPVIGWLLKLVNVILEPVCRRHDWRYQRGYRERDRIAADCMLLFEGIPASIFQRNVLMMVPAICATLAYFCIVLFFGWYTFSRFTSVGRKMNGFQRISIMTLRAHLRHAEINLGASYSERGKMSRESG